jgi:hypothetical protein
MHFVNRHLSGEAKAFLTAIASEPKTTRELAEEGLGVKSGQDKARQQMARLGYARFGRIAAVNPPELPGDRLIQRMRWHITSEGEVALRRARKQEETS